MLMTAINFAPAALFRVAVVPDEFTVLFAFGIPGLIALACLAWMRAQHRKFNRVFAAAIALYFISFPPIRFVLTETAAWHSFTNWLIS
jgi:predicted lysophospholipase L1 biosynthesis ABC-type transport system permease subunit